MGLRKCIVLDCGSIEKRVEDRGVTFHRFPAKPEVSAKWVENCRLQDPTKATKSYVCSRHFCRSDFQDVKSNQRKYILKQGTLPTIFKWDSATTDGPKDIKTEEKIEIDEKPDPIEDDNVKTVEPVPGTSNVAKETTEIDKDTKTTNTTTTANKKKKNNNNSRKRAGSILIPNEEKPKKTSKRLSAAKLGTTATIITTTTPTVISDVAVTVIKPEIPATPDRTKSKNLEGPPPVGTPKKKNTIINFLPGSTIEAQSFDQKWITVKVIEVDIDEREVLVRFEKNCNINDEWISMDSSRLRPAQPLITFEVGEKVLARWNDCRKFPATINRVLDHDSYDVLFDDGYPKIVRGVHINKLSPKQGQQKGPTSSPSVVSLAVSNPLLLNPPSLIPEYIKDMKEYPVAPLEGEWCCAWIDDIPVGKESQFDGPHGKIPSILVPDWRVKEGWQKHIYLRQNGKWDVLFVSPAGKKLRFKNETKNFLQQIGEIFDPEMFDFSLHKKRSKALGIYIFSDRLKQAQMTSPSYETKQEPGVEGTNSQLSSNPFATLGALPYVQPNLVLTPPAQSEISVGSLKVKVVNGVYLCPQETCDKSFRKENHLQLHIKHYHVDLAKLMGECPNMSDLAYLRTTSDEVEVTIVKPQRRSQIVKQMRIKDEANDGASLGMELEVNSADRFAAQKSPILEEALKAPLVTSNMNEDEIMESDTDVKAKQFKVKKDKLPIGDGVLMEMDAERLITSHAVSKIGLMKSQQNKKAMHKGGRKPSKLRFHPKSQKKPLSKKRRLAGLLENGASSVDGIIPYHEGPYFHKTVTTNSVTGTTSTSYVDEHGETIKIVRMKKEEIINCLCGFYEEDGLMIQCELCLCWQHGICNAIEKPHQVPENYVCYICKNPYRVRQSQRYIHDQDWLYDGKLPVANYHIPNPNQVARFDNLKQCHTLIGNLFELKRFMNSLNVKINIAERRGHPKMYLWSKKWESSPPRIIGDGASSSNAKEDIKKEINFGNDGEDEKKDFRMLPIIPEPAEAAIEPAKCQQILLDHIQNQQQAVKSRLETIDDEITELEQSSVNNKTGIMPEDDSKMKQTIYMLLNDLLKMREVASIHK
ncbi:unnamed protein product [Diamesa serratosioi]